MKMTGLNADLAGFTAPQSRLFHLEPVGVGTPFVESLSGYVARLAEQHWVATGHLLSKVVAAHITETAIISTNGMNFITLAQGLNGVGTTTSYLINALEHLTLRHDLHFTAMVTWKNTISTYQLIRPMRAWCPACYEEQAEGGAAVYDQLAWAVEAISLCIKHKTRLELVCPHCGVQQCHLALRSRPGYCNQCRAWLGLRRRFEACAENTAQLQAGIDTEIKIAEWVGDLLAAAPRLGEPITKSIFISNLSRYVRERFGRNALASGATSVAARTVWSWLLGQTLPSLGRLLKVCLDLRVPLTQFIYTPIGEGEVLAEASASVTPTNHTELAGDGARIGNGKARWRTDWDNPNVRAEIEARLRAGLEEIPPPSLRKLCAEMKWNRQSLRKNFPQLYAELTRKSLAHYKPRMDTERAANVLRLACEEEPPPSIREISQRLGPGNSTAGIRTRFPREYSTIIKRHAARFRKRYDYTAIEKTLRDSLSEEPPQPVAAICRRLGVPSSYVFRALREVSALVSRRYKMYRMEQCARRQDSVVEEITSNIEAMLRGGMSPTPNSLFARRKVRYGVAEYYRECRRILSERGLY